MAECATELRDALGVPSDTCPENNDTVMFITASGYLHRKWSKLIQCIADAVLQAIAPPTDIEIKVVGTSIGRNYFDLPELAGKRFRLYRDGIILNSTQYRPLVSGGWELLLPGDILEENQVFIITQY